MKKSLIVLLILAVIGAGAVFFVPGLINWQANRDLVEERLAEILGRPVAIGGDVSFSMLPVPTLTATQVRVAGEEGTVHDLLRVGALDLQVALWPFLSGELESARATLISPVLAVERLPSGALSIDRLLQRGGRIGFERIHVENGTILWRGPDGAEVTATGLFGQVTSDGERLTASGSFELGEGRYVASLAAGPARAPGVWPVSGSLSVDGADGELGYEGRIVGTDRLSGDVTLATRDALRLLAALGGEGEEVTSAPLPVDLAASLMARRGQIELTGVGGTVDGARLGGTARLDFAESPRWEAELTLARPPLDAWRARLLGGEPGDGPVLDPAWLLGGAGSGLSGPSIPRDLEGTLSLAVETASLAGGTLRRLNLDLSVADGAIDIGHFSAELPGTTAVTLGGRIAGEEADEGPDGPALTLTGEATGDLRAFLGWAGAGWADAIPPERLRAFGLRGRFEAAPGRVAMEEMELTLDRGRAVGRLAFLDAGGTHASPRLEAALDIDTLNLDAYLPEEASPSALLMLAAFADLDLDLDLAARTLTLGGATAADVALAGRRDADGIAIDRFAIGDLAGAELRATGRAESLAPLAGLDATVEATVPDLPALRRLVGWQPAGLLGEPLGAIASRLASASGRLRVTGGADAVELTSNLELAREGGPEGEGGGPGTVSLSGTVTQPLDAPAVDLAARVTWPSAIGLLGLLADEEPLGRAPGDLDLYARLRGDGQAIAVEDLRGHVGPTELSGSLALDFTGSRPRLEGRLSGGRFVLDPWLAETGLGGGSGGRLGTLADGSPFGRWPAPARDIAWATGMDGRLDLALNRFDWGEVQLAQPSATVRLAQGEIEVERLTGRIFDGAFGLSGTAAVTEDDRAALAAEIDLVGADGRAAIEALAGPTVLEGELDLALDLAAEGTDLRGLLSTLAGTGHLAMRDGRVATVDLAALSAAIGRNDTDMVAFLEEVRAALGGSEGEGEEEGGGTAFASLNAPLAFDDGTAIIETLRIADRVGVAEGHGTIDLPAWHLDIATTITLYDHREAPAAGIRVTGPPDDPLRRLQTQALQAFVAQRAARDLTERFTPEVEEPEGAGPEDNGGLGAPVEVPEEDAEEGEGVEDRGG